MAKYEDTLVLKDKVSNALKKINKGFNSVNKVSKKTAKSIRNLEKRAAKLKDIGGKFSAVGQKLTVGLTLPIVAAGGAMIKLASDMEETLNKVDVSFGDSSESVKAWAKNSIKTMGLAQQSALDSAALYGDMATGMGLSQKEAAKMAMSLTQLGADLASFKNISNDVAQTALKSIFTGETESLKNLGIVMTETNLKQFAELKGIRKKIKDMTELEKIQLRYNYVMSKTVNAQGDFIRTGGGAANQTRKFQESLKELGVLFGEHLLPYFTEAVTKLNEVLEVFASMPAPVQKSILVLGGLLAVIPLIITGIGGLITAIGSLNTALAFLQANPMVLTITGWTAAVALLLYNLWQVYRVIKLIIDHFKFLQRMKMPSINSNFSNEELDKLSNLQSQMGDEAFAAKFGKEVSNQVSSYRQNNIQTSNNTTNNNFYGNMTLSNNADLDKIIKAGNRVPA